MTWSQSLTLKGQARTVPVAAVLGHNYCGLVAPFQ